MGVAKSWTWLSDWTPPPLLKDEHSAEIAHYRLFIYVCKEFVNECWNFNTLATWWEELTHLKRLWCWERLREGGKGTTEDEMVRWHHRLNRHRFGWTLEAGDGQGGLACYSSWDCKELDTTERLNWIELNDSAMSEILHFFFLTFFPNLILWIRSCCFCPVFSETESHCLWEEFVGFHRAAQMKLVLVQCSRWVFSMLLPPRTCQRESSPCAVADSLSPSS